MNMLGHTHVARAWGAAEAGIMLGAVLPDLASMAGVRIDRARLPSPLAEGVRWHVRTDAAFHHLPAFVAGSGALAADVAGEGLTRGAARAVGHVGWELLLDGTLLDTPAAADYVRALEVADEAAAAVAAAEQDRWRRLLAHRPHLGRPPYDDPAWVAGRLHAMLAARPLLAFPADRVDAVTAALDRHAGRIAEAAPGVLAATVAAG